MPDWVFWLIGAAVLAAGEVATLGFFLGAVALAALPAAAVAAAGAGLSVQLAVFIVGSVASLAFIRPVARRHLQHAASDPHRHGGAGRRARGRARPRARRTAAGSRSAARSGPRAPTTRTTCTRRARASR